MRWLCCVLAIVSLTATAAQADRQIRWAQRSATNSEETTTLDALLAAPTGADEDGAPAPELTSGAEAPGDFPSFIQTAPENVPTSSDVDPAGAASYGSHRGSSPGLLYDGVAPHYAPMHGAPGGYPACHEGVYHGYPGECLWSGYCAERHLPRSCFDPFDRPHSCPTRRLCPLNLFNCLDGCGRRCGPCLPACKPSCPPIGCGKGARRVSGLPKLHLPKIDLPKIDLPKLCLPKPGRPLVGRPHFAIKAGCPPRCHPEGTRHDCARPCGLKRLFNRLRHKCSPCLGGGCPGAGTGHDDGLVWAAPNKSYGHQGESAAPAEPPSTQRVPGPGASDPAGVETDGAPVPPPVFFEEPAASPSDESDAASLSPAGRQSTPATHAPGGRPNSNRREASDRVAEIKFFPINW